MKGIVGYFFRRLASAALTLLLLSLVAFSMVKVIPGDEARVAAGVTATPQQVEAMRVYLGLNKPWPVQYLTFLGHALRGDLGTSISSHTSIASGIAQVLPETIQLVIVGLVIMVVIAVPAAIASALRRRRASDAVVRVGVVVASGLPTFWLALIAQLLLATDLQVFPISGEFSPHIYVPDRTGMSLVDALLGGSVPIFWNGLYHLILPATVLALPFTAQLYRALRTEIIKVLDSEYVDAARAKGLSASRLMLAPCAAQRRRPGHHHPRRHRRDDDRLRDPGGVRLRAQRHRRLPHQRGQQLRPVRRHRRRARDRRHHRRDQLPGGHRPTGPRPPAPRPRRR